MYDSTLLNTDNKIHINKYKKNGSSFKKFHKKENQNSWLVKWNYIKILLQSILFKTFFGMQKPQKENAECTPDCFF